MKKYLFYLQVFFFFFLVRK